MENTLKGMPLPGIKSGELQRLAESPEGLAARRFAEKNENALRAAAESGDGKALRELLQDFLKTPEGARLSSALTEMTEK